MAFEESVGVSGMAPRKPDWLKVRLPSGSVTGHVGATLRRHGLNTVCDEARCPNKAECWGMATATFMVMGAVCTRGCRYCAVATAKEGQALDPREPEELAAAIAELGIRHAVVTSVDRDDLPDRGASHFAACIRAIRARDPSIGIEVLAPDYREEEIEILLEAGPDVYAHNIEAVERLQSVRDARAGWRASLHSLELASVWASSHGPDREGSPRVKSSILLGIGEDPEEVHAAMDALRAAGVTMLVLGQYLRPTPKQIPVVEYVTPSAFAAYAEVAKAKGFSAVVSSPLARTSYHARSAFAGAGGRSGGPGGAEEAFS
ncbi:MAG TPA: lipoyl synthase [Rectinemataceae bacterium]|nr:lipoyl synthase [Rectinemataceae bacterium]